MTFGISAILRKWRTTTRRTGFEGRQTCDDNTSRRSRKGTEYAPVAGDYSIVTDFEGNPMCIIQMTEISVLPFDEVDAEYALVEGEGDQIARLSGAKGHRRYFYERRGGKRLGI